MISLDQKAELKHEKSNLSFSCSKVMKYLRTPENIWAPLSKEFEFTVDICASDENHLLPKYYTKENDALKQSWENEIAYIHPMFDSKIGKFVEKAYHTKNFTGVCLLPAGTHTKYFHEFINNNPKCEVRFLKKPPKGFHFGHDNGSEDDPNTIGYIKPLMIVIFRNTGEA